MESTSDKETAVNVHYRFIVVSSLLCSEQSQNDRCLHITFLLLDAVQDVVATLFDERGRVVLSSCHAVLCGPFG